MSHLTKNLSHLMAQAGINQAQLATAAGVNQGTISRILTGSIKDTGYKAVWKLARYFRLTMDDLVGRDLGAEGPSPQSQDMEFDPEILGSALVTWDKALKHYKVPYSRMHEVPSSLIFAYAFRLRFPGDMDKGQYETFDELVKNALKGELDDFGRIPASNPRASKKRNRPRPRPE
ncbi:MAG TPA: helix-turn-helix transcriptional regulator [Thiobacillus sp.]